MTFSREAEQATQAVQSDADALGPILQGLKLLRRTRLLEDFGSRFAEYARWTATSSTWPSRTPTSRRSGSRSVLLRRQPTRSGTPSRPSALRRGEGHLARQSAGRNGRGDGARDPGAAGAAHRRSGRRGDDAHGEAHGDLGGGRAKRDRGARAPGPPASRPHAHRRHRRAGSVHGHQRRDHGPVPPQHERALPGAVASAKSGRSPARARTACARSRTLWRSGGSRPRGSKSGRSSADWSGVRRSANR